MPHAPALLDARRFEGRHNGQPVHLYHLQGAQGMRAAVSNHGGRLLQLLVPDASGELRDVVLGYDSLSQLQQGLASMGAIIGRYANRIGNARFQRDGRLFSVPANEGPHCLHGGPASSRYQVFRPLAHTTDTLRLGWQFREIDDGFPGDIDLEVCYSLCAPGTLRLEYRAAFLRCASPWSLTNHAFFNLEGAGSVAQHRVRSDADRYLHVSADKIPTGAVLSVQGSSVDFRQGPALLDTWMTDGATDANPTTQDHCLVMPDVALASGPTQQPTLSPTLSPTLVATPAPPTSPLTLRRMASVWAPQSGLCMEVWSDAPAFQCYVGGGPNASMQEHFGKASTRYHRLSALCIEPQAFPDAPNQPHFPSVWHEAGSVVRGCMEYRFSIANGP